MMSLLYAEWEIQRAVVLIYPHIYSDFRSILDEVQDCYDNLVEHIARKQEVWLIVHPDDLKSRDRATKKFTCYKNVSLIPLRSNDVWARDSIAISTRAGEYLDFGFNGWGLKYRADLDNQLNRHLRKLGFFRNLVTCDIILEGGSIDSNGSVILTSSQCLLSPNRNPHLSKQDIEERLKSYFKADCVLWINNGMLSGDDTDGHIDTLARFISERKIAYMKCYDTQDPHYEGLLLMEQELKSLEDKDGRKYELVPLPYCDFTYMGRNLPASYVNFLFINAKTLLVPNYGKDTDRIVMDVLRRELPDYSVIGVDCRALIHQGGGLHCISMVIH